MTRDSTAITKEAQKKASLSLGGGLYNFLGPLWKNIKETCEYFATFYSLQKTSRTKMQKCPKFFEEIFSPEVKVYILIASSNIVSYGCEGIL